MVDGNTLIHTDVTPYNFLLHDGGVTLVDWSMPCGGAAWIDTALMVIRLVPPVTARSKPRLGPTGSPCGQPLVARPSMLSPPALPP
jgi:hypothetical protein